MGVKLHSIYQYSIVMVTILTILLLIKYDAVMSVRDNTELAVSKHFKHYDLKNFDWLIAKIQTECVNQIYSTMDEALCVHDQIYTLSQMPRTNCTQSPEFDFMIGGCCRDWSWFFSKVYGAMGWSHLFTIYKGLNHIKLDIFKEGVYCTIDVNHINCFGRDVPHKVFVIEEET